MSARGTTATADATPSGRAYLRLVGIGALIGIPAALVAACFLALVHELEHLVWEELPDALGEQEPPWYLVIGLPVVGAALVLAARRLLPGDGGHTPLEGVSTTPTPPEYAPGVALAALGTLSFGAVLGPEAPLIALGSAVGVAAARMAKLSPRESAVLGTAGTFSAISALFGGPLVAGMLLLEGGLAVGAALLPLLLPGLVAAAIGYLLFVGLGDWGGLDELELAVPGLPLYEGTHLLDLVVAVAVGVLTALIVEAVRHGAIRIERAGRMPVLLLGGALAVGLIAQFADVLGADPQDVLFSGQAAVPDVVSEESAAIVLLLLGAKALAYAICLGCGFRGGPIFPAIFIGIALATLAVIAFDVSPTLAVAVGAGAGMAAGTRLLIASTLFAALLVGRAGLDTIPAAVLAVAAAWIVATVLEHRAAAAAEAVRP
jgi:H+/Cl- antiporter ClcA